MRHHAAALALLIPFAGIHTAAAQPVPLTVQPLRGGVYWVKGGDGANTGFIVGKTKVIEIDAKTSPQSAKDVLAAIAKVTPNPVGYIVLTHSDNDHVGGLPAFPKGLTIFAHANTKKDMEKMSGLADYMPNEVLGTSRVMTIDGIRMALLYYGPAHTSGDLVVYLPELKIAFVGDLVFTGRDPLIHKAKGGTSFGLVRNLGEILNLDADTFIAGHAAPLTKADIQGLRTSIEEKQTKVEALVKQGKSLDDIRTAFGIKSSGERFPSLVEVIYQDVTARK
jgi:cyclase